jgi:DNA invertase Pin-like site-specific DNA recombinase
VTAVIYARYSSDKQTEQSIEGQLAACYDYAEREGIVVVGEYVDRARSAKTDNRPEFQRMVTDSAKRLFDAILVYQLDRFSRNRYDSAIYKARLKKNGVRVLSARENIAEDASGVLMEAVLEGMAEYYSAELSQKVRRGMDINATKCLFNGGTIPFGFKAEGEKHDRRLVLDPERAPYVKMIFDMYAAGRTVKQITDHLNEKQVRTSTGSMFNKNSLHRMLTNKRYTGMYTYNGVEVPDGIPRIVSDELFKKVQVTMEKNKEAPARARAKKEEYLLTTKLFCGHCRDMMVGVSGTSGTGKTYNYYSCNKARQKVCHKKNVQKEDIENRVVRLARAQLTDENIDKISKAVAALCEKEKQSGDYKRLEKMRRENEKQKANLVDALKYGKATETLITEIAKLEDLQDDLDRQLIIEKARHMDLTAPEIAFFLNSLKGGDINDIKYRRLLITVMVNAIFLYDDRLTVIFNSSDKPVEVTESLIESIEVGDMESSSNRLSCGSPDFVIVVRFLGGTSLRPHYFFCM